MDHQKIISRLPYSHPFLFVDELTQIDSEGATGTYTFPEDAYFYKGHFKDNPITPGVLLTECMAQIGVVCLGIYLLAEQRENDVEHLQIGLSSTEIDFFLPVLPGEKVKVISTKEYYRFNKLKCSTEMFNAEGKLVCRGKIAGMVLMG